LLRVRGDGKTGQANGQGRYGDFHACFSFGVFALGAAAT
jgi:hypothetical protein